MIQSYSNICIIFKTLENRVILEGYQTFHM